MAGEAHTRYGAIRAGELLMPRRWPVFLPGLDHAGPYAGREPDRLKSVAHKPSRALPMGMEAFLAYAATRYGTALT